MMARAFGSTLGIGSTDAIVTGLTEHYTTTTVSMWVYRAGAGGGSLGRMFDKNNNQYHWHWRNVDSHMRFNHQWNSGGTEAAWSYPDPGANAWHHICTYYDSSLTTNDPLAWVDGVPQVVTEITTPVGTVTTNANALILGNRVDGLRNWDGMLMEFATWNRQLTHQEINGLAQRWSPVCFPIGLQEYRPGTMTHSLARATHGTLTGTKVVSGVPLIVTPRWGVDRWLAGAT